MVLGSQYVSKRIEVRGEYIDPARIQRCEILLSPDNMERGAPFTARFSQGERAVRKIECCQVLPSTKLRIALFPVQASRDNEVQYQPKIAFQPDRNAFS